MNGKTRAAVQIAKRCGCISIIDGRPIQLGGRLACVIRRGIVAQDHISGLRLDVAQTQHLRQIKPAGQPNIGHVVCRIDHVGTGIDKHTQGKVRILYVDAAGIAAVDHKVAFGIFGKGRTATGKERGLGQGQQDQIPVDTRYWVRRYIHRHRHREGRAQVNCVGNFKRQCAADLELLEPVQSQHRIR